MGQYENLLGNLKKVKEDKDPAEHFLIGPLVIGTFCACDLIKEWVAHWLELILSQHFSLWRRFHAVFFVLWSEYVWLSSLQIRTCDSATLQDNPIPVH